MDQIESIVNVTQGVCEVWIARKRGVKNNNKNESEKTERCQQPFFDDMIQAIYRAVGSKVVGLGEFLASNGTFQLLVEGFLLSHLLENRLVHQIHHIFGKVVRFVTATEFVLWLTWIDTLENTQATVHAGQLRMCPVVRISMRSQFTESL